MVGDEREVRARLDRNGEASIVREKSSRRIPGYLGTEQPRMPKRGEKILIRQEDGNNWEEMIVKGRGGKVGAKGKVKNPMYFNLRPKEVSDDIPIDVTDERDCGKHIDNLGWKFPDDDNDTVVIEPTVTDTQTNNGENETIGGVEVQEVNVVSVPREEWDREEVVEAMEREKESWDRYEVYEEVREEEAQGHQILSSRWVIVIKEVQNKEFYKARLVARGCEEENKDEIVAESPTVMRDTLNIIKTIVGIKNFEIYSIDIKNAFLQGDELERVVFMKPPPEYSVPGTLWRLRKSVYGMVEAARKWWDRISQRLTEINCVQSKLDPCLFIVTDKSGKLSGFIVIFVDDLKLAGSPTLCEMMIRDIGKSFEIGRVEKNEFVYTGLNVKKTEDGITTDQVKYVNNLEPAIFDSTDI